MLQSNDPPADIQSAKDYMSRKTATLLWQHLVKDDPEYKKFYYDKERVGEVSTVNQKCHILQVY
jgi:hypothetical protein